MTPTRMVIFFIGSAFLSGVAVFTVACNAEARKEWFPSTARLVNEIRYYKDTRTNLCFAHNLVTNSNGFSADVFTNVPCNPEVEALLVKE